VQAAAFHAGTIARAAMPERRPNQIARIAAVLALVTVFTAIAFTVATSGDDSGGGSGNGQLTTTKPTAQGERALEKGYYVVKQGDTLAQIAENTGLDVDNLEALNPNLDPQVLTPGQHVRLSATR
jgi:LysM repeat protein